MSPRGHWGGRGVLLRVGDPPKRDIAPPENYIFATDFEFQCGLVEATEILQKTTFGVAMEQHGPYIRKKIRLGMLGGV